MDCELVIDVEPTEVTMALAEDRRLVELHKESKLSNQFAVGDIYLGRVKKLMPGLNAAFVDVGYEKDAFLHYLDLGPQFTALENFKKAALGDRRHRPEISKKMFAGVLDKNGSITDVLKQGQDVLVQIVKEPISTKGPRLTSEISIAGRYLVLIPFSDKVSVSQKIKSNEERNRLKQLIRSICPKNFGVIIRTVAENKGAAELDNEMKVLMERWDGMVEKMQRSKGGVTLVCEEIGRTVGMIRDLFNSSFKAIYVNDEKYYKEIKDYVELIDPGNRGIVQHYTSPVPILDNFGLTKQIKNGFGKVVPFKNGAYLIVEQTEAMFVIDVNGGNRSRAANDQEENAFNVDMAAAEEIARQLRLRDIGGIISIDFIDLSSAEHKKELYECMRKAMANDRAKHNVLPLSKFCVMQITRQRVRQVTYVNTEEKCPTCYGTGKIRPSILFTDQLESKIDLMVSKLHIKKFYLHVHPFVAAYIKQGVWSQEMKWKMKYGFGCRIIPSQKMGFLQYKFYGPNNEEIDLQEAMEQLS
ncbi:MAG: Rne/Rng family ribonuclease [Paludibacteraceae bacterium]|nr:Rne/Rng family ribonuclease [Paludibacteraceae bacterium]